MRNLTRSLTHIRVYKVALRKIFSLLTTTMLLANSYLPYFAYGVSSQIAYADAPPVLSVTFDSTSNEFELSVNTSSEVSYVVAYTRVKDDGYQVEGLEGKGEDASGVFKKKLYAGTCSAVDCVDHAVKRALVKVQVEDLSWAYEQRYILEESNAFSLVGEGKIENDNDVSNLLELTEDNKKWLEDVNTIQPSLTPTPTFASPTATFTPTPPALTPTPVANDIITPSPTHTVTPLPTASVPSSDSEESLRVFLEKTEGGSEEDSLIDTLLAAIFPFLYTDKSDYAPTEKVIIRGEDFAPNAQYVLTISSFDNPAISLSDTVTTTNAGTFEYVYQLDGVYRPNYTVEAKDDMGIVVAETTFTDSIYICPFTCQGYNLATGFCVGAQSNGCDAASLGSRICTGSTASCVIYTGPIVQCHTATGWSQGYCREDLRTSCSGDWADGSCPPPPDTDGDGVADIYDNCPATTNPDQADDDYDDIGNVCDVYLCVQTGPEICGDLLDNDCNQLYDENCSVCGNGVVETDEVCDDGNIQNGDGCSSVCQNETPELLVINEIDYDQPSTDNSEFIEIKNYGQTAVNLYNYEVRTINNGAPPSTGYVFDLPNVSLASGDYFVICAQSGNTPNCDMDVSPDTNLLQQGPDAVALFFKSASSEVLVDTVSYGGDTPGYTETAGTVADNISLGTVGLSRFPDGQDTNDNNADFILSCISPGLANTSDTDCDKVTVCHSTDAHANPYNIMNPSKSADVQGHDGHNGGVYPNDPWGDIIPPFYYSCDSGICTYPGKNWTIEGQAIWNNDCDIPGITSTTTPTFTPTNTPTPTSTPTSTPPAGRCGDGIENDNEQCDYGPLNGQSSCSSECTWVNECRQEMVANGGFETPVVSQGAGWDAFDNAEMAGWTAEWYGGFSDYNGNTRPEPKTEVHQGVNGWLPASGAQYVELDTDWTGPSDGFSGEPASIALSQDIPTIPGYEYTLDWKHSARPNHNNNHLQVVVGNTEVFNSGNLAGGSNTNWQTASYTFVATTSLTRISFIEIGMTDSLGMFVDDVSVACTEQGATPTPTATSRLVP